ncbi:MAG: hypothetical protein V1810_01465 [Candidatus Beckwithbacteria bacterium]
MLETWLDIGGLRGDYYQNLSQPENHPGVQLIILDKFFCGQPLPPTLFPDKPVFYLGGQAENLPLAAASVSRIDTNLLFSRIKTAQAVIPRLFAEINRVLKPGGQVQLCEHKAIIELMYIFFHSFNQNQFNIVQKPVSARLYSRSALVSFFFTPDINVDPALEPYFFHFAKK